MRVIEICVGAATGRCRTELAGCWPLMAGVGRVLAGLWPALAGFGRILAGRFKVRYLNWLAMFFYIFGRVF